jgi:hypothetical protein
MKKTKARQAFFSMAYYENLDLANYTIPLPFVPADHGHIMSMICEPVGQQCLLPLNAANVAGIETSQGPVSVVGHKTDAD